ncbi:50S ribosomal protein L4 [Mycoplasma struthionis]|nr:50S ribosomal protein L4 [Mycoplasma struthionis]TPI01850.1 50S ribosomal protein L4 [Mycoplasma struthionis]
MLDKYYISEKFDDERNITFNFKQANKKISGNFPNFVEAVEHFIEVAEKSKNNSRVWFHRDGAYRGSVEIEKARIIVSKVSEAKVQNHEAITFIEKENLVDKAEPKKTKTVKVSKDVKAKHPLFSNASLPKEIFGLEKVYSQAVFDAILSERASKRFATHKTKTRAEVSGTGKKPWDQKHTGNARAGSLRSPIFVGGGRVFGPTVERNYTLKVNKKARKNALKSALTLLAQDQAVLVKEYKLDKISTKSLLVELAKDELLNVRRTLLVSSDEKVFMSARNLPNVNVTRVTSLSIEALVATDVLVISKEDIAYLEGILK